MSVTAAAGFVAAGVACGVKPAGAPDLALVATATGRPVSAAAVFTTNKATAAPVLVSREHLVGTGGRAAAVVLNSGNANAATGASGRVDAERMCALVADGLGCARAEVLVCSTGLIGIPLPMPAVERGIPALLAARTHHDRGAQAAARAILTTDTRAKQVVRKAGGATIGGMAKGAAMLAPHMATMLAVLTTDAALAPDELAADLAASMTGSFHALTVDGCMSTNDTVIVLASGEAGRPERAAFATALADACAQLATQMAADAEGATKLVRVEVTGAADEVQARRGARAIAESLLVKCSLHGADPYWGRVVSALGAAGIAFDPERVSVAYGGVLVAEKGVAKPHDSAAVTAHLAGQEIRLTADLGLGVGAATTLTADLTPAYIALNATTS